MDSETFVKTGKVRLSYPALFVAKAMEDGKDKKFGASLIIPKTAKKTIKLINAAIEAAKIAGADVIAGKKIKHLPLKDGDVERPDDPAYEDSYYISARSNRKPGVIHVVGGRQITDPEEIYPGCYIKATISFFAYNHKTGGAGISCALHNVMFFEDGEPLGAGARSAADDFADDIEDEEEED